MKINFNKLVVLVLLSFSIYIFSFSFAHAVKSLGNSAGALSTIAGKSGIQETNISNYIGTIVTVALGTVGLVFLILMVYAGIMWMTARGDETQITKAKNTIIAAVIGIAVTVGAYALTNFVTQRVIEGQRTTGGSGSGMEDLTNAGPPGCCIDWVSSADSLSFPSPACRITTQADCKLQGELQSQHDAHACPGPERGCWEFTPGLGVDNLPACLAKCEF